jgi:hypothetical protein
VRSTALVICCPVRLRGPGPVAAPEGAVTVEGTFLGVSEASGWTEVWLGDCVASP